MIDKVIQYLPMNVTLIDIVEIIIISFAFYHVMVWAKNTRAYTLMKGIGIILGFALVAVYFQMNTILWIAENTLSVGLIALIIVFQPELRKALEQIGKKKILATFFSINDSKNVKERFSDRTINELIKASYEMGKTKTGALMVIEQDINLDEFVATGITLDAEISSQLIINIFEHNTPLHDGAVIIRRNRIVSATCYLPLSDNMKLSKELGTRHRAGVGISEVSDSLTIIVSEETGYISVAINGKLQRDIKTSNLREILLSNLITDNDKKDKPKKKKRGGSSEK